MYLRGQAQIQKNVRKNRKISEIHRRGQSFGRQKYLPAMKEIETRNRDRNGTERQEKIQKVRMYARRKKVPGTEGGGN